MEFSDCGFRSELNVEAPSRKKYEAASALGKENVLGVSLIRDANGTASTVKA